MASAHPGWTDQQVEEMVGRLLQIGVLTSALVVLVGGVFYLFEHGGEEPAYHIFKGEPQQLRGFLGIGTEAAEFRSRGLIQLGLLLLILTPVARVALTVFAFLRQRDHVYVGITLIVLTILVYSLLSGYLSD